MQELWQPVEGFESLYEVSNLGRVRSLERFVRCRGNGQQRKPSKVIAAHRYANGYPRLNLWQDNQKSRKYLHRLVAKAFLASPPGAIHTGRGGWSIDHINGDKTDNRACNLQWMLAADNNRKAKAKLTNEQIRAVREDKRTCQTIGVEYGVSAHTVSAIKTGKRWAHIQ